MTAATLNIRDASGPWPPPQPWGPSVAAAQVARIDEGEWTLVGEPLRDQELRERISASLREVAAFTGADGGLQIEDFGFATIQSALTTAHGRVAGLMHSANVTVLAPTLAHLTELHTQVTTLQMQVSHARVRQTHKRYEAVRNALSKLQGVKSIKQMLERAPAALCRCGFDRVIISRIEESTWTVERVYVHSDPDWATEIAQAGLDYPLRIDHTLVEGDSCAAARPSSSRMFSRIRLPTPRSVTHRYPVPMSQHRSWPTGASSACFMPTATAAAGTWTRRIWPFSECSPKASARLWSCGARRAASSGSQ